MEHGKGNIEKKKKFWSSSLEFIIENIETDITEVLDFGAGTGHFYEILRGRLPSATYNAIEPTPELRINFLNEKKCRVFGNLEECTKYESLRFDVIFLNHVVEHLSDPVTLLSSLKGSYLRMV